MTKHTEDKAERLLSEGRIRPIKDVVRLFQVEGDTGRYFVTLTPSLRLCSCPAQGDCSHILAAIKWWLAEADAEEHSACHREHLAALERRRETDRVEAEMIFERLGT